MLKEAKENIQNTAQGVKTNIQNTAQKVNSDVKQATQKASSGIKNLKVNYNKMYELGRLQTKLVLNTAVHCAAIVGIMNLTFFLGSRLLLIPAGIVVVKALQHAGKTNKEISSEIKLVKGRR